MATSAPAVSGSPTASRIGSNRRQFSITVTLAASIGLLVAIAVFVELLLGISAGRRNTLALLNEKAVFVMDTIETGMRHHLDPAARIVFHIQGLISGGIVDPDDKERLGAALAGMLAAEPQIMAVGFWDTGLQQTLALQRPGQSLELIQQDQSGDREFTQILHEVGSAEGHIWRQLVFADKFTLINVVQPIRREGVLIGFAGAVVTMPELSSLITEISDAFAATGFILYGAERVLAHPHLVSPHPDLGPQTPVVPRSRIGDLVLSNLEKREPIGGFGPAAAKGVRVEYLDLFDTQHVVFTRDISDYGEVPWIIGAHVPASTVNTEMRRMRGAALTGLSVLILSILAAVFLGRRIARPIRQASARAVQIAELNFAGAGTLASSRIKELNDQAAAFNSMIQGLKWFETYVPRELVRRLMRGGVSTASAERELTIMFTDIVGFTSLSEPLPASDVAELLNEHFSIIGEIIEEQGGTIDKFIGDSVMAFWGAPEPQADHAERAVRAASSIAGRLEAENARRKKEGKVPVRIRIGLHTGPVVVGNIGAPGRINYTIVGDTVNTGQRIESLARDFDEGAAATVLMSAATAAAVIKQVPVKPVGSFELKGRSEPVEVMRLAEGSVGP